MTRYAPLVLASLACWAVFGIGPGSTAYAAGRADGAAAVSAAEAYVRAMVSGDHAAVARLDFACQYHVVSELGLSAFPEPGHPVYDRCRAPIAQANEEPVQREDQGVSTLWPGQGKLVFFREDFRRFHYAPSAFVSEVVGHPETGTELAIEHAGTRAIPPASFALRSPSEMVGAPAVVVSLRIHYKDPITAPVSYAAGTYQWVSPVLRPRAALKSVVLEWVVLSDLKRLGFPSEVAVLNLPVVAATATQPAVPFLVEYGGLVTDSPRWWGSEDAPEALAAAVERAAQLDHLMDRVAMLNRVLMMDPDHVAALTALSRDLYAAILSNGAKAQQLRLANTELASRVNELYWDTYAQTERIELSIGMEMGGYDHPTSADYLFRMIPAMERLARLRQDDIENRIRLGIAYRWNLDQLTAIETHAAVAEAVPRERASLRARALTQLATSKIAKVAFNRTFDDPGVREAYEEAGAAYDLAAEPLEKFAAAYTMAYSLVFTPDRDNQAILRHLSDAKSWYLQVPGSTEESWRVLLGNDTLKPVIDADPALQHLVAAGHKG